MVCVLAYLIRLGKHPEFIQTNANAYSKGSRFNEPTHPICLTAILRVPRYTYSNTVSISPVNVKSPSPRPICSSSCKCPYPGRALFSVNSQVRQDAIPIYYACNQILVTPYNSPVIRLGGCNVQELAVNGIHGMPKIELSLYLSSIARNALQHIRWLEWILPSSQRSYLLPRTTAWYDYLDTILLMQNAMNLSGLTLTINIAQVGCYIDGYPNVMCMRMDKNAWNWYESIILPMRCLGEAGLKDFFVHLRWLDTIEGERVHHEQYLERAVMGKDYSSSLRGKPVERAYSLHKRFEEERQRAL